MSEIKKGKKKWVWDCMCTAEYAFKNMDAFPLDTIILFRDPANVDVYVPKGMHTINSNGYNNPECARCKLLLKRLQKNKRRKK